MPTISIMKGFFVIMNKWTLCEVCAVTGDCPMVEECREFYGEDFALEELSAVKEGA